jgi:hypothetical protein
VVCTRGLNRPAVGKTANSFPSGRAQPLAPPTLTSLLPWTSALRRALLRQGDVGGGSAPCATSRSSGTLPIPRVLPICSISMKAKAVPVAASSSEVGSARPTGPEGRPRSSTALRIQLSSKGVL